MAEDATVIVESSPTEKLKQLTPAEHKTWRATGNLPEPKVSKEVKKTEAASSPAATKEAPESVPVKAAAETSAEPVPAKVEPDSKPKPKGAEARIKDLLAENKKLAQDLEDARKSQSVPAKKTEALAKPGRNDIDEKNGQPLYRSDDEYMEARDKWVMGEAVRKTRMEIAHETQERETSRQNELMQRRMQNSVKIATENHPDFLQVLKAETKEGKTVFNADAVKAIKTNGVLDAWILDSEQGMEMLYYLASRLDEVERIQSLGPFAAARELTKLEEKLSATSTIPAKEEKAAESLPAPTTKKEPPAPATSITGKNTPPVDEENAALEALDYKRYARAANETEWRKKKVS